MAPNDVRPLVDSHMGRHMTLFVEYDAAERFAKSNESRMILLR